MLKNKQNLIYRIVIIILFIVLFLIGARVISFGKHIYDPLVMFLILTVMFFIVYKYIRPLRLRSKQSKASEEEKGYTKEGAILGVGTIIYFAGLFFEENLILMFFINVIGVAIAGFAVYSQYKKPRDNKYVLRNAKIYLFGWIMLLILFIVLTIVFYLKYKALT